MPGSLVSVAVIPELHHHLLVTASTIIVSPVPVCLFVCKMTFARRHCMILIKLGMFIGTMV